MSNKFDSKYEALMSKIHEFEMIRDQYNRAKDGLQTIYKPMFDKCLENIEKELAKTKLM